MTPSQSKLQVESGPRMSGGYALAPMPFGNSVAPRVFFVPKGQRENSPAFQRWEHDPRAVSPKGTAENLHASFCFQPSDQPSLLRDLGRLASIPSLEKAGLFSFVPPGHKAANLRKTLRLAGIRRSKHRFPRLDFRPLVEATMVR